MWVAPIWLGLGCGEDARTHDASNMDGSSVAPDSGAAVDGHVLDATLGPDLAVDAFVSSRDSSQTLDRADADPSDAAASAGTATLDDGKAKVMVAFDKVECEETTSGTTTKLVMAARTSDYLTQVIVSCAGTAVAAGTYPAADPYVSYSDVCTLEVPWKGSYFSFGMGTISHRLVNGVREISVQGVSARGYHGDAADLVIMVSGLFTCPT